MKLSIIIPAYNEERRIESSLDEYLPHFSNRPYDTEFIIIIEGDDKTLDIVKNFQKSYKNIVWEYSHCRLGKGGAIVRGFKHATGDLIGFVDADASTKPQAFEDLVKNISINDGVIASRKISGAKLVRKEPLLQRVGSRGFNTLVRLMFFLPFKDTQCGAKLFTRQAVLAVLPELGITEFSFDIDLLFRLVKKGFKIKELPTVWEYKPGTQFNFRKWFWKLIPSMFLSLCRLRLLYSPLKQIIKTYDSVNNKLKSLRKT